MTHLLFAGIGGVGGYFGGRVALHHAGNPDVRTTFLARGEHARVMRAQGLALHTSQGTHQVSPTLVTDDAAEAGIADFILLCTKSYDLEAVLTQLRPCIGPETVVVPFLNGVDHRARIAALLPGTEVWDGCVYTIARLVEPGVVRESGGPGLMYFGAADATPAKTALLLRLMTEAGIRASVPEDIVRTIWEKFFLISPMGTLTSYLDLPIGPILADVGHTALMQALFSELYAVATALGVALPADIGAATLAKMAKFPADATSSMHSDYQRGSCTEVASLTGFVVEAARRLGVDVPVYAKMWAGLTRT